MKTSSIYDFLLVSGRGVGQVMFQNNALSGWLMLLGILLNSWQMGLLAIAGNTISTLTARIAGTQLGITTLTAPFVLSVWITMGMRKIFG